MEQIGNVNQILGYLEMLADSTINATEDKTVCIHTCGCEKQRCTVIFTLFASEKKLQPFCVFKKLLCIKKKPILKGKKLQASVIV